MSGEQDTVAVRLLAAALQIEPEDVGAQTAIGSEEKWDSLAHMRLVLALEEFVGKELNTEQMLAIESFSDVVAFLNSDQIGLRV